MHNMMIIGLLSIMIFQCILKTMFTELVELEELGTLKRIAYYVACRSTGKSLTFMSRSNWKWARQLIKILSDAGQVGIINPIFNLL